jgi:hypothetical protein
VTMLNQATSVNDAVKGCFIRSDNENIIVG